MWRHKIGQNKVRENGWDDDRNGSGESFQNVVRIFHHKWYKKTTKSLNENDTPRYTCVSLKEAILQQCMTILKKDGQQRKSTSEQTKLQITNPKWLLTEFDQLFKVNTRKTGRKTGKQNGHKANQTRPTLIWNGCIRRWIRWFWIQISWPLNQSDTDHKQKKRNPLFATQLSSKHQGGEESCGQNFQLVCDLCARKKLQFQIKFWQTNLI